MRCFVGVDLSAYSEQFTIAASKLSYKGLRPASHHHSTIEFWQDLPDGEVRMMEGAITRFAYRPFDLSLDTLVAMPDKRTPMLVALSPSDQGLRTLRKTFRQHADPIMDGEAAPYYYRHKSLRLATLPHVTLVRARRIDVDCRYEKVGKDCLNGELAVRVDNITLFRSMPGEGGERYDVLANKRFGEYAV